MKFFLGVRAKISEVTNIHLKVLLTQERIAKEIKLIKSGGRKWAYQMWEWENACSCWLCLMSPLWHWAGHPLRHQLQWWQWIFYHMGKKFGAVSAEKYLYLYFIYRYEYIYFIYICIYNSWKKILYKNSLQCRSWFQINIWTSSFRDKIMHTRETYLYISNKTEIQKALFSSQNLV